MFFLCSCQARQRANLNFSSGGEQLSGEGRERAGWRAFRRSLRPFRPLPVFAQFKICVEKPKGPLPGQAAGL